MGLRLPAGPKGLVVAIQFWAGDQAKALRLARLLAAIEPRPRGDVTMLLICRKDTTRAEIAFPDAVEKLSKRFPVMVARSARDGEGHPAGCNALAGGTLDHLAGLWRDGFARSAVFLAEADGCPLRADWLDRLLEEHERTIAAGKSVTGPYMGGRPHINGSMVLQVPWWIDHPSVQVTPPEQAWDLYHRDAYLAAARPTKLIANIWGSRGWTAEQLGPMSREVAWLTGTKDDSAFAWAAQSCTGWSRERSLHISYSKEADFEERKQTSAYLANVQAMGQTDIDWLNEQERRAP